MCSMCALICTSASALNAMICDGGAHRRIVYWSLVVRSYSKYLLSLSYQVVCVVVARVFNVYKR